MAPKTQVSKQSKKTEPKTTQKQSEPVKDKPVKDKVVKEEPVVDNTVDDADVDNETDSSKKTNIPKFKFDGDSNDLENQIKEMKDNITKMQKEINHELTMYRHFVDDLGRYTLRLRKEQDKVDAKKANRKNAGHKTPRSKISDELAEFLGLPSGSEFSRPEALGVISKYAREHKLNDVEVDDGNGGKKLDKRIIRLDDKLKKIFPKLAESGEPLFYKTILSEIGSHFESNDS